MRIIQFRVPKTASSSLEDNFKKLKKLDSIKYKSHGHAVWKPILRQYNKNELKDAVIVGSCRNPYDRLLSAYKYVLQFKENKKDHPTLNFYFKCKDFEEFCKKIHHFRGKNLFLREQCQWLYDDLNNKKYKDLIHFETLESDWEKFCEKYNLTKLDLPIIRKTKRKNDWNKYYNEEMKKNVYKFFQRDFQLLGYKN